MSCKDIEAIIEPPYTVSAKVGSTSTVAFAIPFRAIAKDVLSVRINMRLKVYESPNDIKNSSWSIHTITVSIDQSMMTTMVCNPDCIFPNLTYQNYCIIRKDKQVMVHPKYSQGLTCTIAPAYPHEYIDKTYRVTSYITAEPGISLIDSVNIIVELK